MQVINHCIFKQQAALALEHKEEQLCWAKLKVYLDGYLAFDNDQKYILREKPKIIKYTK